MKPGVNIEASTATAVRVQRDLLDEQMRNLRLAVKTELGWAPKATKLALPLLAAALGLAFGVATRRRLGPRAKRRS